MSAGFKSAVSPWNGGGGLVPEVMFIPSVISSTSPLSPKHLASYVSNVRSQGPQVGSGSGSGSGDSQQSDLELSMWQHAGRRAERAAARIRTYWVNFHVGEPGSASTIVASRESVGEGSAFTLRGTLVEGDDTCGRDQVRRID